MKITITAIDNPTGTTGATTMAATVTINHPLKRWLAPIVARDPKGTKAR
jgi:hypothetical protein